MPTTFQCGDTANGEIVGLGPAAHEHDLRRFRVNQLRDLFPRVIDQRLGLLAEPVNRRCIAEILREDRHHCGHDLWPHGSRCVTI